MKYLFMLLFFAANIPFVQGQNTITGKVTDQETGEPIVGANIYFPQLEKGTITPIDGFFKIENLPSGQYNLNISALGYASEAKAVSIKNSEEMEILLKPSAIEIAEVIISTPFHQLQSDNVMKVARADIEELQKNGFTNLSQGIAEIPGVSNISTGTGIGKPVIRGLSAGRVLVFTQGIRLENQQFGGEHGLGLSSSGIESVEVIKGPASLLYGSDAIGGVLYINPEKYAPQDSTAIDAAALFYANTLGAEANIGYKTSGENLKFLFRGNYATHSDYLTGNGLRVLNSRFNEWDLKTGVGFQNEKFRSDLRYNYHLSSTGIPEAVFTENTSKEIHEPFQKIENHIISLHNKIYLNNSSIDATFGYILNNRKEFEEHHEHEHGHEGEDAEIHEEHGEEPALEMHLSTFNYDVKYNFPKTGNFETIVGLQGMFQQNENFAEEILIPDAQIIDAGFFFTTHYHQKDWDLQGGLRFDRRFLSTEAHLEPEMPALEKDFSSINAAVGLKYEVTPQITSRLNFSSGFRAPNLAELTSQGSHHGANRYEIGNSNLENEQAFQVDLALEYGSYNFEIFGNVFYNKINNYIFLQPTGGVIDENPVFQYVQNNAELYGAEAGVHFHPRSLQWFHLESSFSTVVGIQENGNYLPLIPADNFLNKVNLNFEDFLFLKKFYTFLSMENYLPQNRNNPFEEESNAYTLFNIGFGGTFFIEKQPVNLRISAQNLFDTSYIAHLSRLKPDDVPNMGRNILIGLSTSL